MTPLERQGATTPGPTFCQRIARLMSGLDAGRRDMSKPKTFRVRCNRSYHELHQAWREQFSKAGGSK